MENLKEIVLDKVRRSKMPEKEKRKWTKYVRNIRGHQDGVDEHLQKIYEKLNG